jgi:hypothetical protein
MNIQQDASMSEPSINQRHMEDSDIQAPNERNEPSIQL